jgi:hypothetical protein
VVSKRWGAVDGKRPLEQVARVWFDDDIEEMKVLVFFGIEMLLAALSVPTCVVTMCVCGVRTKLK